jgi:hypothetical protein
MWKIQIFAANKEIGRHNNLDSRAAAHKILTKAGFVYEEESSIWWRGKEYWAVINHQTAREPQVEDYPRWHE